jgi:hypothetical protein
MVASPERQEATRSRENQRPLIPRASQDAYSLRPESHNLVVALSGAIDVSAGQADAAEIYAGADRPLVGELGRVLPGSSGIATRRRSVSGVNETGRSPS